MGKIKLRNLELEEKEELKCFLLQFFLKRKILNHQQSKAFATSLSIKVDSELNFKLMVEKNLKKTCSQKDKSAIARTNSLN